MEVAETGGRRNGESRKDYIDQAGRIRSCPRIEPDKNPPIIGGGFEAKKKRPAESGPEGFGTIE
jgi:hypothetical protein